MSDLDFIVNLVLDCIALYNFYVSSVLSSVDFVLFCLCETGQLLLWSVIV